MSYERLGLVLVYANTMRNQLSYPFYEAMCMTTVRISRWATS